MACSAKSNGSGEAAYASSHDDNTERFWTDVWLVRQHCTSYSFDRGMETAAMLGVFPPFDGVFTSHALGLSWRASFLTDLVPNEPALLVMQLELVF